MHAAEPAASARRFRSWPVFALARGGIPVPCQSSAFTACAPTGPSDPQPALTSRLPAVPRTALTTMIVALALAACVLQAQMIAGDRRVSRRRARRPEERGGGGARSTPTRNPRPSGRSARGSEGPAQPNTRAPCLMPCRCRRHRWAPAAHGGWPMPASAPPRTSAPSHPRRASCRRRCPRRCLPPAGQ